MKKWELVEENKPMILETTYHYTGNKRAQTVYVDVYRKLKFSGMYKYKTIIRK